MANRLYYSDAFLKSFNATVTDIREVSRTEGPIALAGGSRQDSLLPGNRRPAL